MKITPAIFPPHIAKAYGVRAAQPAATVTPAQPAQRADSVAKIEPTTIKATGAVERLVAKVVAGSVSFTDDGGAFPSAPSLPIYAHPADRNAAATGVAHGSTLDVEG